VPVQQQLFCCNWCNSCSIFRGQNYYTISIKIVNRHLGWFLVSTSTKIHNILK